MIEKRVKSFEVDHKNNINVIFHILGIILMYASLMTFLWIFPQGLITNLLGDSMYARWATLFAVVMIVFYGSESFYLTFVMGGFMLGLILLTKWLVEDSGYYGEYLPFIVLAAGLILILAGHLIEGNPRRSVKDLSGILFLPAWLFDVFFKKLGISI